MRLDAARATRENEVVLACRTGKLPLAKRIQRPRRNWDGPIACFTLRLPDRAVAVGALADVKLTLAEVDVFPTQAAELRSA